MVDEPSESPKDDTPATEPEERRDATRAPGSGPALFWLVPALTFALGLLLGGAFIAASMGGDDDRDSSAAAPARTPAPNAGGGSPGDLVVVVPESCIDGLEQAERALADVSKGVDALRDADAAKVQQVLNELQKTYPDVARLAKDCRKAADAPTTVTGDSPSPTARPSG